MFILALLIVFLVAAASGYLLQGWRGVGTLALLLLLALAASVVALGEVAILVAAYGGGPIF